MSSQDRKRREVEIGLANNAFGAAAGTVATVQARNAWKRSAKKGTMPNTRIGRLVSRSRISPGKAIMVAGGLNVAGQAANGLLDAQSAQYFARERMSMPKKSVTKGATMHRIEDAGNGHGSRIVEPVFKDFGRLPGTPEHTGPRKTAQATYFAGLGAAAGGLAGRGVGRGMLRREMRHQMGGAKPNRAVLHRAATTLRGSRAAMKGGLAGMAVAAPVLIGYGVKDVRSLRRQDLAAYKRETGKDYPGMRAVRRELKAKESVGKARRFDAEADRQRRMGAYAGLAGGAALVVGDRAAREVDSSVKRGTIVDRATGKRKAVHARHVGFKPGRGRIGAGLAAGSAGLAALSAGTYKRGISERNQPWA